MPCSDCLRLPTESVRKLQRPGLGPVSCPMLTYTILVPSKKTPIAEEDDEEEELRKLQAEMAM